jgi:NodT family efflux transporter outer membrane factor (OMF) lipoprotein
MNACRRVLPVFVCLLSLPGCLVGPDYVRPPPASDPATTFKETTAVAEGEVEFRPALPRDTVDRGPWWTIYGDSTLDRLMAQVNISNQTLKENEAAYRQAVALIRQSRSPIFPTIALSGGAAQAGSGSSGRSATVTAGSAQGQFTSGASLSWELDVWGAIRRTVESDAAAAQASAGTLESARLSAQSSLATAYFSLRITDERIKAYRQSVAAYTRSLEIVRNQVNAGTASGLDQAQAETQLEQTRALYVSEGANRAVFEHAIAALIGKLPVEVNLPVVQPPPTVPTLDAGVPSTLLERRPDIAASERQMQAANAQIGVAVAAYYPTFTFTASINVLSTMLTNVMNFASSVWSVGASVAATAFEGGARAAAVEGARANYDKTVATYRQTVITAFQQVEDALAQQRYFELQESIQRRAVASAHEAERLSLNQYQAGTVSYTTVVTAQTAALVAEQTLLDVRLNRFTTSSTLVTALGGGWRAEDIPKVMPLIPGQGTGGSPVKGKSRWWPF